MSIKSTLAALSIILVLIFASCGEGSRSTSSTTGWEYNTPENGGFSVTFEYRQEAGPGLVFIEGGTFTMGRTQQDLMYQWNNPPRRVTVASFYMDETEVKNVDYREYLYWLQRVYVDYPQVHENALPDTLVWRTPMGYNEPYVETYFRHPAYNDYPVVGVSWLQANDYCLWRTDRVNERRLMQATGSEYDVNQVNEQSFNTEAYLAGQYESSVEMNLPSNNPNQESRRVNMEDGIFLPKYRLPTEAEWEYAALSLIGNTYNERIYERRLYPWDGHNVRNPEGNNMGKMMANFKRGKGDMMGVAGSLNDRASIPAPVDSYWPNDYNLYCMAGNVNEWVLDVYRPLSFEDFEEFRPFRGNVFKTLVRDENGEIAQKDSLGRLRYREITEEEAAGRRNYSKADYKNYMDGDLQSSIEYSEENAGPGGDSERMYGTDPANNSMTSLISDRSRVYKGGSWKDRAYWLNPGTRRYRDEGSAANDLGFRCAMNRVVSLRGVKYHFI